MNEELNYDCIIELNDIDKEEQIHLLLGNGFTNVVSSGSVNYEGFTDSILERIIFECNDYIFKRSEKHIFIELERTDSNINTFKFLVKCYKEELKQGNIKNVEDFIFVLQKFKALYLRLNVNDQDIIDSLDIIYNILVVEISKWIQELKVEKGLRILRKKFTHIFTLNYSPLNNLLKEGDNFQNFFWAAEVKKFPSANLNYLPNWGARLKGGFMYGVDASLVNENFNFNQDYPKYIYHIHSSINFSKYENEIVDISKVEPLIRNEIRGISPTIVLSGTGKHKKDLIDGCSYKKFCLDCLGNISGTLMVFGATLNQYDIHIVDCLKKNKNLDKLIICIYASSYYESMTLITDYLLKFDLEDRDRIYFLKVDNEISNNLLFEDSITEVQNYEF